MAEEKPQKRNRRSGEAAEKRRRALELRRAGVCYSEIAKTIGYSSPSSAWRAVDRALDDACMEEDREAALLDLIRLDRLFQANWTKATKGEPTAIDRCLKILERRARLLGLKPEELWQGPRSEAKSEHEPNQELLGDEVDPVAGILAILADAGVLAAPAPSCGPTSVDSVHPG